MGVVGKISVVGVVGNISVVAGVIVVAPVSGVSIVEDVVSFEVVGVAVDVGVPVVIVLGVPSSVGRAVKAAVVNSCVAISVVNLSPVVIGSVAPMPEPEVNGSVEMGVAKVGGCVVGSGISVSDSVVVDKVGGAVDMVVVKFIMTPTAPSTCLLNVELME